MAQQQLSPRKYIQTRARKLPIYKCLVNRDWREGDMASVFVMRRHVNGNITAGSYLVDLLCLGVKDTFFWFNEPEAEVMSRMPPGVMMEIDYNLAHNIIWAGHDFAADLDIDPVKDFALTQMILEEDNDDIPLIEIHTGDENGRPRLVSNFPGQYSKELAILKKNLGDGGFSYVAAGVDEEDFIAPDEEGFDLRLADLGDSDIGIETAARIATEDLLNDELVKERSVMDQMTLSVERFLRALANVDESLFTDIESSGMADEDYELLADGLTLMPGSAAFEIDPEDPEQNPTDWILDLVENDDDGESIIEKAGNVIGRYRDKPMVLMLIADFLIPTRRTHELPELVEILDELSSDYLLARILLARLAAEEPQHFALHALPDASRKPLRELFPDIDGFDLFEFYHYFLLQLQLNINSGDTRGAIRAYNGLSDVDESGYSIIGVQLSFGKMLEKAFHERVGEDGEPRKIS